MLKDKIKEMGDNLKTLEGYDRLQYLVDKAKEVQPLPEAVKIEANRIHGCASKLWIIGGADSDQKMIYQGYIIEWQNCVTLGLYKNYIMLTATPLISLVYHTIS